MFSQPLLNLSRGAGPFSAATETPSPPYYGQFSSAPPQVQPDPRLVNYFFDDGVVGSGRIHPPRDLHGRLETDQLAVVFGEAKPARGLFAATAGSDRRVDPDEWQRAKAAGDGFLRGSEHWDEAMCFDRNGDGRLFFDEAWRYLEARRAMLVRRFDADGDGALKDAERHLANDYLQADLFALAAGQRSQPVKPAQPLGILNALLLTALLVAFYRIRKREGQVFALLLILYPITRFALESVRADNQHNLLRGILTHNQYTSLALMTIGMIMWGRLRLLAPSAGPTWAERPAEPVPPAGGKARNARKR